MSHHANIVSLDSYDGYGFEQLCADILERAGYGSAQVTQKSGDGGKDIILTTPNGETIFVECKHHPNSTIGRPVIQKLHSAMITGGASSGIVITSGRFSTEAIEHVKVCNLPIQLIDRQLLAGLAAHGGTQIHSRPKSSTSNFSTQSTQGVTGYEIPKKAAVENVLRAYVSERFYSAPKKPENLIQFKKGYVTVNPVYAGRYDLDYTLSSSTRVLKHDTVSNGLFLIDGKTGEPISEFVRTIFEDTPRLNYEDLDSDKWNGKVENFRINETVLHQRAFESIKNEHSHTVHYMGGNNQLYAKSGSPSNRDIEVYNVEQVYIPEIQTTMKILDCDYVLDECYCNDSTLYIPNVIHKCSVCGGYIDKGVICNDCGAVVHIPRKHDSHSFICEDCGKTICRDCTYIAGGKHVCLDCAKKSGTEVVKIGEEMKYYGRLTGILSAVFITSIVLCAFVSGYLAVALAIAFVVVVVAIQRYKRYEKYLDEYILIPMKK